MVRRVKEPVFHPRLRRPQRIFTSLAGERRIAWIPPHHAQIHAVAGLGKDPASHQRSKDCCRNRGVMPILRPIRCGGNPIARFSDIIRALNLPIFLQGKLRCGSLRKRLLTSKYRKKSPKCSKELRAQTFGFSVSCTFRLPERKDCGDENITSWLCGRIGNKSFTFRGKCFTATPGQDWPKPKSNCQLRAYGEIQS